MCLFVGSTMIVVEMILGQMIDLTSMVRLVYCVLWFLLGELFLVQCRRGYEGEDGFLAQNLVVRVRLMYDSKSRLVFVRLDFVQRCQDD